MDTWSQSQNLRDQASRLEKNDAGLCEEQLELQFSGRNEGETESTEGEVFQAKSQSADQNNVPRQAENANFANSVNIGFR